MPLSKDIPTRSEDSGMLLDRPKLLRALKSLAKRLRTRGVRGQVHIIGRAAMILSYRRSRSTSDVDALVIEERDSVLCAAREDARELGLSMDWLNDDVRNLYFSSSMSLDADGPALALYDLPFLTVTGASASQLLAMKLRACRNEDLEDVRFLLRELGVKTMEEFHRIHDSVFPDDEVSPRKIKGVRRLLHSIDEGKTIAQRVPAALAPPPNKALDRKGD